MPTANAAQVGRASPLTASGEARGTTTRSRLVGITAMKVREIQSKSIQSSSQVYDYVVNPYVECEHGCGYCYARFMKRFTGHREPWGEFVDVKTNAPELLDRETDTDEHFELMKTRMVGDCAERGIECRLAY